VPGFALYEMGGEAQDYVAVTLERFQNPFLEHPLADIHQNHDVKLRSRVAAFLEWLRRRDPGFDAPRLAKMLSQSHETHKAKTEYSACVEGDRT